MTNLNQQIDLFLTEISIELLGNKMYDVNGKRKHKLVDLFKAVSEDSKDDLENTNDLLCSLGYDEDFTQNFESISSFLEDQLDYTLTDANTSENVNRSIVSFLRKYKADQEHLMKEISEIHVKKLVERKKLQMKYNHIRQLAVNSATTLEDKDKAAKDHYTHEQDQLTKSCADVLRLIKHILNDTEDEAERGEMIGFIHAVRTIRDCEDRANDPKAHKIAKPYKK